MKKLVGWSMFVYHSAYAGSCSAPVPLDVGQDQATSTPWLIFLLVLSIAGMAYARALSLRRAKRESNPEK